MALKIVTGGTTGAADGTLVSSSNKIAFTALDTPVNAHMRCDDDTYSADETFTLPSDGAVQVSFDGGTTWYGSADSPRSVGVDIGDLNVAIKLRQHAATASTSGTFSTDGSFTAATALSDVSGFTATHGDGENTLSWTAVTNRTSYVVDRATNAGFTTGVTLGVYTGTGTSFTDTGLTNGTTYYYRIKAVGTVRYKDSASYATANATPAALAALTGFVATLSGTTISLSWTAVGGATYYQVDRATDAAFTTGVTSDINSSGSGTSFSDTGRTAGTSYYYRVRAFDGSGVITSYGKAAVVVFTPSVDGMAAGAADATWSTARSNTDAASHSDSAVDGSAYSDYYSSAYDVYDVYRFITEFDTSPIPDGATINEATLSLYCKYTSCSASGSTFALGSGGSVVIRGVSGTSGIGGTDFASRQVIGSWGSTNGDATPNVYKDFALNSSGKAAITKTGTTKLAAVTSQDADNTAHTYTNSWNQAKFNSADAASNKPRLIVAYSE